MPEPRRTFTVTVRELCEHCNTLQEHVEKREHVNYWPSFRISMKSCLPCFEAEKRDMAGEFNAIC